MPLDNSGLARLAEGPARWIVAVNPLYENSFHSPQMKCDGRGESYPVCKGAVGERTRKVDEITEDSDEFAAAFRALIAVRGMSLSSLQRRLAAQGDPVSMATLSYWRSGARRPEGAPSLSVVAGIEDILGVDSGALARLIRPAPRVGRVLKPEPMFGTSTMHSDLEETARALGTVEQAALRDLSVSITAHVATNGDLIRTRTSAVVQATAGRLTEVPVYDVVDPEDKAAKVITDVIGARVDRSFRHPGGRIICDVLAFDDPVPAGETAVVEYTEHYPSGYRESRAIWHAVDRPNRQTLIWVRFAAGAEPDWCEEYTEIDGQETVRMLPAGRDSVHSVRFGFGPGTLGVRWGYDDERS